MKERYTFEDLLNVMDRIREDCPWDRAQTHQSLEKYLIEEAYELLEALRQGNPAKIADESGDLLFQVVFHARIGRETGAYDIRDVTDAICRKLIHRHPHVFGDAPAQAVDWDAIKRAERNQRTVAQELRGVSAGLPALMRAEKILGKAQAAGYTPEDWPSQEGLGGQLFALVRQCREAGVSPELALQQFLGEFTDAFEAFEKAKEKQS